MSYTTQVLLRCSFTHNRTYVPPLVFTFYISTIMLTIMITAYEQIRRTPHRRVKKQSGEQRLMQQQGEKEGQRHWRIFLQVLDTGQSSNVIFCLERLFHQSVSNSTEDSNYLFVNCASHGGAEQRLHERTNETRQGPPVINHRGH